MVLTGLPNHLEGTFANSIIYVMPELGSKLKEIGKCPETFGTTPHSNALRKSLVRGHGRTVLLGGKHRPP